MNKLGANKRNAIGEKIYLAYFVLMTGARAFGMYEGTLQYAIVLLAGFFLFAAKMVMTRHLLIEYVVAAALMLAAGIVYLHTGEKGLIVCFMTVLGMKCVDRIKTIRCGLITASACITFRILTGVTGLIPEKYYPQVREGVGLMFRHALGYAHPNTLHMNVFMLGTLIMYSFTMWIKTVDEDRLSSKCKVISLCIVSVLVFVFNLYVFQYSGSRTGVLATGVYLLVNIWFYIRSAPGIPEKIACFAAYPTVCFIAIVLPHILPESIFDLIDRTVFTTRFTIGNYFWSNNKLSLWGIRLNNPVPGYRTYGIDMAHLYLFLQLGIIAFALISILTLGFVYVALNRKYMTELALLLGVLCAGIWEPFLYNLGFKNMSYVFMGALLYDLIAKMTGQPVFSESGAGRKDADSGNRRSGDAAHSRITGFAQSFFVPKNLALTAALCAVIGGVVAVSYLALTPVPSALYADRSEDEAGEGFGMDEIYLTEADVTAIKEAGDLVVGYTDVSKPMYEYDEQIAHMEYHKKILSVGVWTGIMCVAPVSLIGYKLRNKRTVS